MDRTGRDDHDDDAQEKRPKMWFDHMHGYLTWKVFGPDIHNPFSKEIPYRQLQRMASEWDYLNQYIQVRCMCDGYEVMMMTNPLAPRIASSHPTVSTMRREDIVDFMSNSKIFETIADEAKKIQDDIREHLKAREEKNHIAAKEASKKTGAKKEKEKKPGSLNTGGGAYRIIKR